MSELAATLLVSTIAACAVLWGAYMGYGLGWRAGYEDRDDPHGP